jgi:hypothetical protein
MARIGETPGRFKFEAAPVILFNPAVISPKSQNFSKPGAKKQNISEPSYFVQALIPPDHPELKALKDDMKAVAKAEWGPDVKLDTISFPLSDGTKRFAENKKLEAFNGMVVLRAGSKLYAPALFYVAGGKVIEVDEAMRTQASSKFYSGVEASIEVNLVAWEVDDNKSVVAYLSSVCSLCTGKKLGGAGPARYEGFARNVGTISDVDPSAGADDDEIPF